MLATIDDFHDEGEVTQTPDGIYIYKDRGAKVLAVAHLDSVPKHDQFFWLTPDNKSKTRVHAAACDDRLGAYVILDLLPRLGVKTDVLLTEGEERGRSTAAHFQPPEGKQYHWMISFDRSGTDVVLYQYGSQEIEDLVEPYCTVGFGSYSDIADLEHLGCTGFNWGTGYYDNHSRESYFIIEDTESQVEKFLTFWDDHHDTPIPAQITHRWWHGSRSRGSYLDYLDRDPYDYWSRSPYESGHSGYSHTTYDNTPVEPYPVYLCDSCDVGRCYPVTGEQGKTTWICTKCHAHYYAVPPKLQVFHCCPTCRNPLSWIRDTRYRCIVCNVSWVYSLANGTYYIAQRLMQSNHGSPPTPEHNPPEPHARIDDQLSLPITSARDAPPEKQEPVDSYACWICKNGNIVYIDADEIQEIYLCDSCSAVYTFSLTGANSPEREACHICYHAPHLLVSGASEARSVCYECAKKFMSCCHQCGSSYLRTVDNHGDCPVCHIG
jgi:uncharacterized protein YbaR (Trm112 family)